MPIYIPIFFTHKSENDQNLIENFIFVIQYNTILLFITLKRMEYL